VLRVAVRVELRDFDGHRLASSSTVNSGTRVIGAGETPEVLVGTEPCFLFTRGFVTIRWSDNRLSSVRFDMPVGYFNPDAHC
jgi:hypothetical protein